MSSATLFPASSEEVRREAGFPTGYGRRRSSQAAPLSRPSRAASRSALESRLLHRWSRDRSWVGPPTDVRNLPETSERTGGGDEGRPGVSSAGAWRVRSLLRAAQGSPRRCGGGVSDRGADRAI